MRRNLLHTLGRGRLPAGSELPAAAAVHGAQTIGQTALQPRRSSFKVSSLHLQPGSQHSAGSVAPERVQLGSRADAAAAGGILSSLQPHSQPSSSQEADMQQAPSRQPAAHTEPSVSHFLQPTQHSASAQVPSRVSQPAELDSAQLTMTSTAGQPRSREQAWHRAVPAPAAWRENSLWETLGQQPGEAGWSLQLSGGRGCSAFACTLA